MIKSSRKSEKSTRLTTRKTGIWTNFIKFSSIFVICLAITLAGVKIPAKADDYYVRWYTSSTNPIHLDNWSYSNLGSAISDTWESDLGEYGYVEFFQTFRIVLNFSGFTTGYTYLYYPIYYFSVDYRNIYPTGFTLDSVDLDWYTYSDTNISTVSCTYNKTSTTNGFVFFNLRCGWDWHTMIASNPIIQVNVRFKVRYYCSDSSAVSLHTLGVYNLQGTIAQDGGNQVYGAYIANFSPIQLDLAQYQQFLIANNYLDSIATAISPSAPPDPAVAEAETAASEAADLQSQEEEAFESFASDYDEDEIDEVLETLDPLEIDDIGIATGLVFWKDWLNYHFNSGYDYGEHYNTVLSMVLNMIARLWH